MIKNVSPGIWFGIAANIITITGGLMGLWVKLESRITEISLEQTGAIASIFARDLRSRINLLDTEISDLKDNGQRVPKIMKFRLKTLQDQMDDLTKWGFKDGR